LHAIEKPIGYMKRFVLLICLLPLLQTVAGQTHTLTTCSGVPYNFSVVSEPVGTTYTWTTPTVTGATGGVSSPTPKLRLTDTLVNNNIVDGEANYIVNSSEGNTYTLRVIVKPFPVANAIPDQSPICANTPHILVPFSGPTPNTDYYWTYPGNIGLANTGYDPNSLPPFTGSNTSNVLNEATILVYPLIGNCVGNAVPFKITVKPLPNPTNISPPTLCHGVNFGGIVLTSNIPGTILTWTNDNTAIGLASSDISVIPAFTPINNTTGPLTAQIQITSFTNGCYGDLEQFTFLVNPIPVMNPVDNFEICGALSPTVTFSSPGYVGVNYIWTNSNTSNGLPASSNGQINSLIANNFTATPTTSIFEVRPTIGSCIGLPVTFTMTVKSTPQVINPGNKIICANNLLAPILFTGSSVSGTEYQWQRTGSDIGIPEISGTGDIAAFTATNFGIMPISSSFIVSPFSNACYGPSVSFTIRVNPTPTVLQEVDQVNCEYLTTVPVTFSGSVPGTIYNWMNTEAAIGIPNSGSGNIGVFTYSNPGSVDLIGVITVTPMSNSCSGIPMSYSYTAKAAPDMVIPLSQTFCNGVLTTPINFVPTTMAGAVFNWTRTSANIGTIPLTATGNIDPFTATNIQFVPIQSVFTVTPFSNGCNGPIRTFRITVNPTPNVNVTPSTGLVICGGLTSTIQFSGSNVANTSYTWTNTNPLIGIGSSGTGPVISFTTTNTANIPITALLQVIPVSNSCSGTAVQMTILVKPTPVVSPVSPQILCAGASTSPILFSGSIVDGTQYNWVQTYPDIGLATLSSSGPIASFTTTNIYNIPISSLFTVTPFSNGCTGSSRTFSITVNPTPSINTITDRIVCSGTLITLPLIGSIVNNTNFSWTNNNSSIGIALVGSTAGSSIAFTATNNSVIPITGRLVITPFSNGCNGIPTSFSITVQPAVSVNAIPDQVRCNGTLTNDIIFSGSPANTVYNWTQLNNLIGLPGLSGTGDILAFTTNTGGSSVPIVSVFTVTPFSNGCNGPIRTFSITVNPTTSINTITDRIVCSGTLITLPLIGSIVNNTNFSWTNTNNSIGIASVGSTTGSSITFTATNNSVVPITGRLVITPFSNGCNGIPTSFSITVQPAVSINAIPDQVKCNGTLTNDIIFSGSPANTVYNWTQLNSVIGLPGVSGTGNILAFTTNTGGSNVPIVSMFTVTPMSNSCSGATQTFSILVNPVPSVTPNSNVTFCNGTANVLLFTGSVVPGTEYEWTNTNPSIGLAASGTSGSNPFIATNNSNIPITAFILVTPVSNSCSGTPNNFTITVNPIPSVTAVPDQSVCNNEQVQAVTFVGSALSGTSYQWVRTNLPIGAIALSGTGNIPAFTGQNIGNVPVTSVFTVTPFSNTCSGTPIVFSITVNPLPTIDPVLILPICAGIQTGAITFTGSSMDNTLFSWTNSNTTIGLAATGNGSIASFTAINTSNVDQTANITVTPMSNSCSGSSYTFQLVIKPAPTLSPIAPQEVCAGTVISTISFTGTNLTGSTINWTNNNINTGLSSSGTGNINAFTSTNISNSPIESNVQVIATLNDCSSSPQTFTIRVNPTPSIDVIANQVVCGNGTLSLPSFTGSEVSGTLYQWTNTNPAIGIAASGTGSIAPFTVLNNFFIPIAANITVIPISNTCAGTPIQFTILVNPTPAIVQIVDQFLCKGAPTTAINFSGSGVANTLYSWTNSNPAVGLASTTGSGSIASFTSINNSSVPVTAIFTVTPISNSCAGVPIQFSIQVNPIPSVDPVASIAICGTQPIGPINFVGNPNIGFVTVPGTNYSWTNSNSDIGLPLTGTGSIASFSATNLFNIPISSQIIVTPISNSCSGTPISFSIQIRPSPKVDSIPNQALCTGLPTQAINFAGSTIPNTSYNWTNSNPAIGLASATGSGNIPSFTVTNLSNGPITSIFTVTPFSNACSGTPLQFNITVNPIPAVNPIGNISVCGNTLTGPIVYTGSPLAGTLYQWTNNNTNIGLPGSGEGTILAFTSTNNNNVPVTALFTVTPLSNTCFGLPQSFLLTVIPSPQVNAIGDQALCTNSITAPIVFDGATVAGTEYRWNQTNTAIGLASVSGTGNINSFTAANNSNIPITSFFTVSAFSNTCYGTPKTFSITVNPIPAVNPIPDMVLCGNANSGPVLFSGSPLAGTLYQWMNNNTAIGLAASGIGNINSFTALNSFNTDISALITVTPVSNTCSGTPKQFTIVIKPTPGISAVSNQTLCTQLPTVPVTFVGSTIPGTEYQWVHDNPAVGLGTLSGVAMVPAFTTTNLSNVSISSKFTVTPFTNGCFGTPIIYYIIVDPIPRLDPITNQVVCGIRNTNPVIFTGSPIAGTVFNWTNNNSLIGLPISGSGNISSFTASNNSTLPITGQITVTPFSNTCYGIPQTFNILVKPTPGIDNVASQFLCSNTNTQPINFVGSVIGGTRYDWTNDNTFIGLASAGTGSINSFITTNSYNIPLTSKISATAFSNGCISDPINLTITVNPIPSMYGLSDLVVCATQPVNEIVFSGSNMAGTIYQWTNNNTLTGLPSNGAGNVFSFTAINSSNITISSLIRVTPISNTCSGIPAEMVVFVKPTPTIDSISNLFYCRNTVTQPIIFTGSVINNTIYNWTQSNNEIGLLPTSGSNNIPSFTAQNISNIPINSRITVTPFTNGCNGTPFSFDINVSPTPSVNPVADITICGNEQINPILFSGSAVPGTEYRWINDNTATGISASGVGNIEMFSATNNFTVPIVSRITVTAFSNNCSGNSVSFTVTIKPTPRVDSVINQIVCSNTSIQPILFTGSVVAGTQYQWSTSNVGIGISAATGIGNIQSFTAITTSSVPNTAQFTVVPFSNSCSGNPITFSITVNPVPTVNSLPDVIQCGSINTNTIIFQGSPVPGTIYEWTNNNTSIGLGSAGIGNIASFSAVNSANLPVSALITVTPFSNGCSGASKQFNIIIKSTPSIDIVSDQIICSGKNTNSIIFSGSKVTNTKYNWVAANSLTGIPTMFGSDSIPSFATSNISNVTIRNTITVTPFSNGCSGTPVLFNYIVHPIPNINLVGDQVICGSALSAPIILTGSLVENTLYEWNSNNPSIGLPSSGTNIIPSFTPTNSINVPVSTIITATPLSNSCYGTPISFSIIIKPIPVLDSLQSQVICNTFNTSAVILTSSISNTSYTWTNSNIGLGLPTNNGSGNIPSFKAINNGVIPGNTTIEVTPLANGCLGTTKTFTITVNPTPILSTTLAPTGICNNTIFSYTLESETPGTSFLWQRLANPNINGNTTSGGFTQFIYETLQTTNTLNSSAVYAISLTANGCSNAQTIAVSISPSPVLSSSTNIPSVCSGSILQYTAQTATPNTLISWSRGTTAGITNAPNTGINTISEILTNNSLSAVNVNYTVTLTTAGCSSSETVTATILPTPMVTTQNFSVCSGGLLEFTPSNVADSTKLTWELPLILPSGSISGALQATTPTSSFTQRLINNSSQIAFALYTVKTTANNCSGNTFSVTVQVLPSPVINSITLTPVCSGTAITYLPAGVSADTRFSWSQPEQIPRNSLTGTSSGNNENAFTQTLFALNTVRDTAIYTVQASSPNCVGTTFTITVLIKPTPFVNNLSDTICSGERFTYIPDSIPAGTQFIWSIPQIFPLGSVIGTTPQSIPVVAFTQTPVNIGNQIATLNYQVNAVYDNCISQPFTLNLKVTRPIPVIAPYNSSTCSGVAVNITPRNMPSGISFSWDLPVNNDGRISGGTGSLGEQSTIQLSLVNRSILPDSIQYSIIPHLDNCIGQPFIVNVLVTPLPIATATGPGYICQNVNDSLRIEFSGRPPYNFIYSDNGTTGARNNITANPYTLVLPPAGPGVADRTIKIYQISDSTCTNFNDTVQVYQEVKRLPIGKLLSLHGNYICNNIPDTLFVISADSVGYQWRLNGNIIPGQNTDSLNFATQAGIYQVTLTDGFGCSDTTTNSIRLIVSKPPVIKFKQDIRCINSLITFTNQTDSLQSGPLSWKWDFGNGLTSTNYHATTTYQVSGSYQVIVSAQQLNCGAFPPTILDSVIQISKPIDAVDSLNVKAYKNQNTVISARFIPNYRYEWRNISGTTAGLRNPNSYETIFNFGESVRYGIKLISPEGCITNDSMWVRVFNVDVIDIFVPKTFTPNNDGRNDKIFPYLTPGIKVFNYFKIYNRFGNILFESRDYSMGWDGRVKGVEQPIGIYFWEVNYVNANGNKESKYGQFLLSR
jgi:gliding motility-associated-like protein